MTVYQYDFDQPDGSIPAPWQDFDYGNLIYTNITNQALHVRSNGDFWSTADTAGGVAHPVAPGPVDFSVDVSYPNGITRFGRSILLRESLDANSALFMILRNNFSATFTYAYRGTAGAVAEWTGGSPNQPGTRHQIIFDESNTFTALVDGTVIGDTTFSNPFEPAFACLVATRSAGSGLNAFDNVTIIDSASTSRRRHNNNKMVVT
ncbi:MAG: hypothetical protein AAF539_16000 [Planctomycetota bacterium]